MKRKLVYSLMLPVAVISIFSFFKFYSTQNRFSELQLKNIEALVDGESNKEETCYNTITSKEGSKIMYCPICDYISGTSGFLAPSSTCTK